MKIDNQIRLINAVNKYDISVCAYMGLVILLAKKSKGSKELISILIKAELVEINNKKLNLTSKGKELISKVEKMFKPKKKTIKDILGDNYELQIKKYIELFPKLKLPNGKQARVSASNLEKPMMWFFQEHNYTWDIVLKATKVYVDEYRRVNFKFMRTSQYFVRKQEVGSGFNSELSNYCDMIINNEAPINKPSIKSKVV
jgi:hypothetical protein